MLMWPLLFILTAFADENSSEKYCFKSNAQREKASNSLKGILVPSDQVTAADNCLLISMKPHRRELIQSYLRHLEPDMHIAFSSAEIRREPCKLQVEKISKTRRQDTQLGANLQGGTATQTDTDRDSRETFQIQTLSEFELSVNQDLIKGSCRSITPDRYEITLKVAKVAKPLVPGGLPAGSIVVLNSPPPDQETSNLETTLQLVRGSAVEIGSVIKDLRNKNRGVSIEPQLRLEETSGTANESLFLRLN